MAKSPKTVGLILKVAQRNFHESWRYQRGKELGPRVSSATFKVGGRRLEFKKKLLSKEEDQLGAVMGDLTRAQAELKKVMIWGGHASNPHVTLCGARKSGYKVSQNRFIQGGGESSRYQIGNA